MSSAAARYLESKGGKAEDLKDLVMFDGMTILVAHVPLVCVVCCHPDTP